MLISISCFFFFQNGSLLIYNKVVKSSSLLIIIESTSCQIRIQRLRNEINIMYIFWSRSLDISRHTFNPVSSYTFTVRSVQTETHILLWKSIRLCGYLDKHTRLNFYLCELEKRNIYQAITDLGDVFLAPRHSSVTVSFYCHYLWCVEHKAACSLKTPKCGINKCVLGMKYVVLLTSIP